MKLMETQIRDLLKEFLPEADFECYGDAFDLEIEGDRVTVLYHGEAPFGKFKKVCKKTISACIDSVLGAGKKVFFVKKKGFYALTPKARKNLRATKFFLLGMGFVCVATAVIVVLASYIETRDFHETFYSASSIKVDERVRVIQLSDLHGVSYGEKLAERVKALKPDVILCTGDMLESVDDKDTLALMGEISKVAPTYYIYGNNEVDLIYDVPFTEAALDEKFGFTAETRDGTALLAVPDPLEIKLEHLGVKVLKNEMDTIHVKGMEVDVYGVLNSNPSSFWSYSETPFLAYRDENPHHLKLTAVHEPFLFEVFPNEAWGDLLVCGHTHGGLVQIPVLGPLYTHEGGLLPERSGGLVYGRYDVAGSRLIVSSGLYNSSLFRINNPPELVIIDINQF